MLHGGADGAREGGPDSALAKLTAAYAARSSSSYSMCKEVMPTQLKNSMIIENEQRRVARSETRANTANRRDIASRAWRVQKGDKDQQGKQGEEQDARRAGYCWPAGPAENDGTSGGDSAAREPAALLEAIPSPRTDPVEEEANKGTPVQLERPGYNVLEAIKR